MMNAQTRRLDRVLAQLEENLDRLLEDASQGSTSVEFYGPPNALQIIYGSNKAPFSQFIKDAGTSPERTQILNAIKANWAKATGGKGDFLAWVSKTYGKDDTRDVKHSADLSINNSSKAVTYNPDGPPVVSPYDDYVPANSVI